MPRPLSTLAPDWWDYTTLDPELLRDAFRLTIKDLEQLSRPGFQVVMYDTVEDFYLAEALEYIDAWRQSTADRPAGICGPIGPTVQLPLVARIVNALDLDLRNAHFWGMDEWIGPRRKTGADQSPAVLCEGRHGTMFQPDRAGVAHACRPPALSHRRSGAYSRSFDAVRCVVMQGGQGDAKHWAFNDPPRRDWRATKTRPRRRRSIGNLTARITDLHPMTTLQNARTSGERIRRHGAYPAVTVGPVETWKAEKVSIWHPKDT